MGQSLIDKHQRAESEDLPILVFGSPAEQLEFLAHKRAEKSMKLREE